jgi:hypothetical protein
MACGFDRSLGWVRSCGAGKKMQVLRLRAPLRMTLLFEQAIFLLRMTLLFTSGPISAQDEHFFTSGPISAQDDTFYPSILSSGAG